MTARAGSFAPRPARNTTWCRSRTTSSSPRLDDRAAIAELLADKDREHTEGAGFRVTHSDRVVDGRKGYVWTYGERGRYWYYAPWFPQPVHSVRLECVARGQIDRFKRLCTEAVASLKFPMARG